MSNTITLETAHGAVDAWLARPRTPARGGLLILQEIFGLNAHIRAVADRFAAAGYTALAPALFDPVQRGVELGYDDVGARRGGELRAALGFERALDIVDAGAHRLRADGLAVAVVGYCWGGSVAFLVNARLGLPAVSYYGARTMPFLDEPLRAPMLFHFGGRDRSILPADIELHRHRHPQARIFVYPDADHAFNRDVDNHHHHPEAAALAYQRTLDFLAQALA